MPTLDPQPGSSEKENRLAMTIWRTIPSAWLGDLQDSRVRSEVVKTITQNHGLTIIAHALVVVAFYLSYPLMQKSVWLQVIFAIFMIIAVERYRIQKTIDHGGLSETSSIAYLLISIFYSGLVAIILSVAVLVFLQSDQRGLNSPAAFIVVGYYFAVTLKNISVRLVSMIFNLVLLAPMAFIFLLKGHDGDVLISIFLVVLILTMMTYAKTMEKVFTSGIKQRYEMAALTAQLIDARDRADAASQSKTHFLAAASHDLRQPVHAIGLYLTAVKDSAVPQAMQHAVDGIRRSWRALDDLLSKILELSHAEDRSLQAQINAISLAEVLRDMSLQHAASAEKKGLRIVVLGSAGAVVLADTFMLRRVLSNLLDNAIKYAPQASVIAVAVRSRGSHWAIQVRDAGQGIAKADQGKVFDVFFQINNPQRSRVEGYGIGLSIVHRFVQAMGGSLLLRSTPNKGTCIEVHLPKAGPLPSLGGIGGPDFAAMAMSEAPYLDAQVQACIASSGKNILFVDDDPLVIDSMAQVFRMLDLPHQCVASADQALLHMWQALVLISDLRLPGEMSGLDLAHRFVAQGIPTLLITGENLHALRQQLASTPITCLQKPVGLQQMLDWLQAVVPKTSRQKLGSREVQSTGQGLL